MATCIWVSTSDTSWFNSSNWSTGAVPQTSDDVKIGNGASSTNTDCNIASGITNSIKSLDMTGYTGQFIIGTGGALAIGGGSSGNVTFAAGANYNLAPTASILFNHSTTGIQITTNGANLSAATVAFGGVGGGWQLQDTNRFGAVSLSNGTLNTNGTTCNWTSFAIGDNGGGSRTLTLGASIINLSASNGTPWNFGSFSTGTLTVNANTSNVVFGTSSSTRTFAGGGYTFYNLTYTIAGSTGQLNVTGSNTFNSINFSDSSNARTLQFQNSTTTTITGLAGFNVFGTTGKLMTIANSSTSGSDAHTLTYTGTGLISCDYLSISHSTVTQSNTWYAGANSTDGGTNTRWIFTGPPTAAGPIIYRAPSSLFIDTSSDKNTIQKNSVGTTISTIGLSVQNNSAGGSSAPQFSPMIELIGAGYGAASQINKMALQAQSVSGSWSYTGRVGDGYLAFLPSFNNAAYGTPQFLIDGYGNTQSKGFITYGGTTTKVPLVSPWTDMSFTNSFSNYGAPYNNTQYCKDINGIVHLRGAFKGPGGGGSAIAWTLPAGFRPSAIVDFPICTNTAYTTFGGFQIPPTGVCSTANANTFLLLDGMSFTAEQ